MIDHPLMVGLGELLWDLLPAGRVLGGAPANFAYMSAVLGDAAAVASRVGKDELGREALRTMHGLSLTTSYVQLDDSYGTGTAGVLLDSRGQPKFTIKEPAAWDFLAWTPEWEELSACADVVCFGSLAQRSTVSSETIERFLRNVPRSALLICDANLREPFYSLEVLRKSFKYARIVKLNNEEILQVSGLMEMGTEDEEAIARRLMDEFDLELVCITRGERGSLLISDKCTVEHGGLNVNVADAVGAGDAFTACLAHCYIRDMPLEEISERANRFGAWVATQIGATPLIEGTQLKEILTGGIVA